MDTPVVQGSTWDFDRLFKLGNKFQRRIPVVPLQFFVDRGGSQTQQGVPIGHLVHPPQPLTTRHPIAVPVGNPMEGYQVIPWDFFNPAEGTLRKNRMHRFRDPPPPDGTKRGYDSRDGPGDHLKGIYSAPKRMKIGVFELANLLTALPKMKKKDLLSLPRHDVHGIVSEYFELGEPSGINIRSWHLMKPDSRWGSGDKQPVYQRRATPSMSIESLTDAITSTIYNPDSLSLLTSPFQIGLASDMTPKLRWGSTHLTLPPQPRLSKTRPPEHLLRFPLSALIQEVD